MTAKYWIFLLFSGHGTGYLNILSFLEMLIVNGAPIYLLAAFMEETVSGESLFVSIRAEGRRRMLLTQKQIYDIWHIGYLDSHRMFLKPYLMR